MSIVIKEADINCQDARLLISELNKVLTEITGSNGTQNFRPEDVKLDKSIFLIAYIDDIPYGCGALRKISDYAAEIKRIYSRKNTEEVGKTILKSLEIKAKEFGYSRLLLETRFQNTHAINFYRKNGYIHCNPYGKYVGKENSYCFKKNLNL